MSFDDLAGQDSLFYIVYSDPVLTQHDQVIRVNDVLLAAHFGTNELNLHSLTLS